MNTSLVKSVPNGVFAEVSVLMSGWENVFEKLISQKQPIRYDMYPLPGLPAEIRNHLVENGYQDLILENDRWQHFLVPTSN
jgi:hypothetical protein